MLRSLILFLWRIFRKDSCELTLAIQISAIASHNNLGWKWPPEVSSKVLHRDHIRLHKSLTSWLSNTMKDGGIQISLGNFCHYLTTFMGFFFPYIYSELPISSLVSVASHFTAVHLWDCLFLSVCFSQIAVSSKLPCEHYLLQTEPTSPASSGMPCAPAPWPAWWPPLNIFSVNMFCVRGTQQENITWSEAISPACQPPLLWLFPQFGVTRKLSEHVLCHII